MYIRITPSAEPGRFCVTHIYYVQPETFPCADPAVISTNTVLDADGNPVTATTWDYIRSRLFCLPAWIIITAASYKLDMRLDDVKKWKIGVIKLKAAELIEEHYPDWIGSRHRDQLQLAITTSLGLEEFETYLTERQRIRDRSNEIERLITAMNPETSAEFIIMDRAIMTLEL